MSTAVKELELTFWFDPRFETDSNVGMTQSRGAVIEQWLTRLLSMVTQMSILSRNRPSQLVARGSCHARPIRHIADERITQGSIYGLHNGTLFPAKNIGASASLFLFIIFRFICLGRGAAAEDDDVEERKQEPHITVGLF